MSFKISDPNKLRDKLQKSTLYLLEEIKKEHGALNDLGKVNKQEKNYAFTEILNKIGFADIRSSLNIENITLRIGQTKELSKIFQLNHELKKTDSDLTEMKGSVEAMNSFSASEFLEFVKEEELSSQLIREIHSKIMQGTNIDEKDIGNFRNKDVEVSKGSLGDLEVCPFIDIHKKISELCVYFQTTEENDPIILGAWIQHELSRIHPFVDGNGRTLRKMTDWCLNKFDYFQFHIGDISKAKYYDLLDAADCGDYNPLIMHMAELQLENISIFRDSIENKRESRRSLFDDIKFVKKREDSRSDVNYQQWRLRYKTIINSFTNLVFEWNERCAEDGADSRIHIYPKQIIDQDTWTSILRRGSVPRSTAFGLDFLGIENGRYVTKFCSQAFFSKHRTQGKHIDDPDEVKIKNSRSPFTETVGMYFGGYVPNNIKGEEWKNSCFRRHNQDLRSRRVTYKMPTSPSNVPLRGIVQVRMDENEHLYKYEIFDENREKVFIKGADNSWQWIWSRNKFDGEEIDSIAAEYIKDVIRNYIILSK